MTKRKHTKTGSIIIGIGIGILIGLILTSSSLSTNNLFLIPYFLIPILIFGWFGNKHPVITETLGYVLSIYILFQFSWDLIGQSEITSAKIHLLIAGSILLLINILTGEINYKIKKAKVITYRTLGMR